MNALTKKFEQSLARHIDVLGFDPRDVEQTSFEWFQMRLGVITASQVSKVVAKTGSQTRINYMAQLVAEIATGEQKDAFSSKATEWGIENEPRAIETYQFITGRPVERVPFVMSEDMRCGASPDGVTDDLGVEIKCPFNSENHVMSLCEGFIKSDYQWQVQYSMWVSGLDRWDFCSFDPRMKRNNLHIIECEKSEKHQKTLDDAVPQFISDMDKMLYQAGFRWGEQWQEIEFDQPSKPEPDEGGVF